MCIRDSPPDANRLRHPFDRSTEEPARMNDWIVAALLLAPLLGGLAAWFLRGRTVKLVAYASMYVACSAGLGLAVAVFRTGRISALGGVISIDALGAYLLILTVLVAAMALAASPRYISHELAANKLGPRDEGHYYALFLWFVERS